MMKDGETETVYFFHKIEEQVAASLSPRGAHAMDKPRALLDSRERL